jgi:YidC/Oxa1 family membrane protein insertase
MMIAGIFEIPASVLAFFYSITTNYALAISMIAVVVMLLVTPLNLKSTKGMLEMQRLAPEMRKLQNQYKGDRTKLNEEMMKLYQEHKVNPMASCLPLVAQMPVFIIMFRILHGMTYEPAGGDALVAQSVLDAGGDTRPIGFVPRYLAQGSDLYQSLVRSETMTSFGLDLSKSAKEMLGIDFAKGLIYAALVVLLGALYLVQQRMVASRAAVSPTMSPSQQKLMQYLPVAFAVFQVFFLLGLVVYYLVQTVLRIAQQYYITKRFYSGDESLGRQAQAASARARELAQSDGAGAQPAPNKRDSADSRKNGKNDTPAVASGPAPTKRTTAPKNRPTSSTRPVANRPGGTRPPSKKRNG